MSTDYTCVICFYFLLFIVTYSEYCHYEGSNFWVAESVGVIVGCVGLKRISSKKSDFSLSDTPSTTISTTLSSSLLPLPPSTSTLKLVPTNIVEINHLCVQPNYQRHGIGRQLLNHLMTFTTASQIQHVNISPSPSSTFHNFRVPTQVASTRSVPLTSLPNLSESISSVAGKIDTIQ